MLNMTIGRAMEIATRADEHPKWRLQIALVVILDDIQSNPRPMRHVERCLLLVDTILRRLNPVRPRPEPTPVAEPTSPAASNVVSLSSHRRFAPVRRRARAKALPAKI